MDDETTKCSEPLCPTTGVTGAGEALFRLLGERCLTVFAPTGSCDDPAISPLLQLIASNEVSLPVAISPGCQQDLLDVIVCESFLGCLSPCPGGPTECPCLVLPQCHR